MHEIFFHVMFVFKFKKINARLISFIQEFFTRISICLFKYFSLK